MAIHVRAAIVALLFCLTIVFTILTLYASNTDAKRDSHQNERGIKSMHWMEGDWQRGRGGGATYGVGRPG